MAHGFLQSFGKELTVRSAGTEPAQKVNPRAVRVMREAGIDISSHKPTPVGKYLKEPWDFVITVCDNARETCPVFTGTVKNRIHIGFEDPWLATGTEEYVMGVYRKVRDGIKERFYNLYIEKMNNNQSKS